MISVKNLTIDYPSAEKKLRVLENVHLEIPKGGTCAVLGASGCGKSTLLKAMAGILTDFSGTIAMDGEKVNPARQKIGFIPQNYGLLPWKNVQDNITVACRIKNKCLPEKEKLEKIMQLLGLTGLEKRYPKELSGGQQQRVGLARIFLLEPDILLMDEPFSALDAITREEMQEVFLEVWKKYAVSTVLVTHYVEEALYMGQQIAVFSSNPGRIFKIIDNPLFGRSDLRYSRIFFDKSRDLRALLKQEVPEPDEIL